MKEVVLLMPDNEDQPLRADKGFFERLSSLDTTEQLFFGLVIASFGILVILAFMGKSAEMTVLGAFTAIALAFLKLEKFSEFSALGFSGKLRDALEKVDAIAGRETEIDLEESISDFEQPSVLQVSQQEKRALEAIYYSKFTFRSVGGISEKLGVTKATASRLLNTLAQKGLVSHSVSSKRRSIWNITEEGIVYLQRSSNDAQ